MENAQITTQRRIEEEYRRLRDEISAEAERLRSDLEEKQGGGGGRGYSLPWNGADRRG
jgi:hypothetical protein